VAGSAEWGDDILAIGTFIRDADANLYNFYIVDPSEEQIRAYAPAADGGGFPTPPSGRFSSPRDVSKVTDMYIDGDIWIADGGVIRRVADLKIDDWEAAPPGDDKLRPVPAYRLLASATARREGTIYGYDPANQRVIALSKVNGSFLRQYRLADGATGWSDMRGWYVEPGVGGEPDALVWIGADGVHRSILEAKASAPGESGAPGSSAGPSGSNEATPGASQ
jgi:hypothetical protein